MSVQSEINRINGAKSDIGAAIAEKGVTVPAGTKIDAMAALIGAIQTGIALPTLTNEGAAADLLSGKQLIDDAGNIVTGSMPSVTQATPSISVSTGGLITASATQSAGKVAAGTKSATKQLTVQAAQTITPGTSNKTIASGSYLTGTQTIKGDANLLAENIKSGVSIFGVTGSLEAGGETGGGGSVARGTFTIATAKYYHEITHDLGKVPEWAVIWESNAASAGSNQCLIGVVLLGSNFHMKATGAGTSGPYGRYWSGQVGFEMQDVGTSYVFSRANETKITFVNLNEQLKAGSSYEYIIG